MFKPAGDDADGLQRTLRDRHVKMIALGGVIGAGLFVGSGVVVQSAVPAAVVSFALTGALVVLVMRMLGEMAVAFPGIGGFYQYSRLAMGELAGFLTGWMYWYFWIIVVALEAVAGAKLLAYWYPDLSPWACTLGLTALFRFVNLLSVRSWGETEFWFASIKVAAIVVCIVPWNDADKMSRPYVSALEALGIPGAADMMNAVILTAVLSAPNSGVFGSSRMLMALARRGDAPQVLARLDSRGVPVAAIVAGTVFGYVAVVMSYVSSDKVFAFLVNSYGTVAVFVYVLIAVSQLVLRRRLELEAPEKVQYRMWGYPYLTWIAIAAMACILTAMAFIPEQRISLLFGVVSVGVLLVAYAVRGRRRRLLSLAQVEQANDR